MFAFFKKSDIICFRNSQQHKERKETEAVYLLQRLPRKDQWRKN